MDRRDFMKASVIAGAYLAAGPLTARTTSGSEPWFDKPLRWEQLVLVESDPGRFDPDFWLDYFNRIHLQGVLLGAAGVVTGYPTQVPLHHRSSSLGDSDLLGYLVSGCRKMGINDLQFNQLELGWDNDFISDISLNGKHVGVNWYGSRLFEIDPYIKKGENTLEIRYTTTLNNKMKSPKPSGLIGPVRLLKEVH